MTIDTDHGMDVVGTFPVPVGGIHGHHIPVTAGDCRVTGLAGIPGIVGMSAVTGPAADSFVHPHGGAVILGSGLVGPVGGMALHADALYRIIGHQHSLSFMIDIGLSAANRHAGASGRSADKDRYTGSCAISFIKCTPPGHPWYRDDSGFHFPYVSGDRPGRGSRVG